MREKGKKGVPGVFEDAENEADNRDYELENRSLQSGVGGRDRQAVQEIGHYDLEVRDWKEETNHRAHRHAE